MKFENTKVMNFDGALHGMRNPMNSWDKSDSIETECAYIIGENDMKLAQKLIRAGSEHRKFMRQIFVSVDITAPLYWWKEFDTYKVGTVANSTSTMHKLATTPITLACFEMDDCSVLSTDKFSIEIPLREQEEYFGYGIGNFIDFLEGLRQKYLKTKDKRFWKELIRWLPESWLQTRTVTMSYENLYTIVRQRKNHKLSEWSVSFLDWVYTLPYAQEFIFIDEVANI